MTHHKHASHGGVISGLYFVSSCVPVNVARGTSAARRICPIIIVSLMFIESDKQMRCVVMQRAWRLKLYKYIGFVLDMLHIYCMFAYLVSG